MPEDEEKNTVADLIEALRKLDRGKVVVLQGCDCINIWSGTVNTESGLCEPNEILLTI
jgi:hypothetical protein